MTTPRSYARIYYDDLMREFPDVYMDDALLSTWIRLLVLAEKMWPIPPEVPRSVRIRTYQRLVESKLVIPCEAHCYRIRGLDAERMRRQNAGRKGAAVRWQSDGNADRNANALPRRERDETRQDEKQEDAREPLNGQVPVLRPVKAPGAVREYAAFLKEQDA